jgi:hypothetical protein
MTPNAAAYSSEAIIHIAFIPDHYAQIIQSRWRPGTAAAKTLLGNLKLDAASMIPVTVFRCPQCGLLKQYATR